MWNNLARLFKYRGLIQSLVAREVKARYRGSVLGFFWSFINPLLLLGIYSFIFATIMKGDPNDKTRPDPYALFMFCGILPWTWFSASLLESSSSLISGGNLDPHELESLLEYELDTHHKETAEPSHAVQKVADALPGFGIVAAVLGIVSTMASIDVASTAEIGHKVGAALVGTFLGILVAYGIVGPISTAMEHKAHEESKAFEVVKMALVASVRGYPPPVAVEFARKLLFSSVRPNFKDLEQELRGKKPAG